MATAGSVAPGESRIRRAARASGSESTLQEGVEGFELDETANSKCTFRMRGALGHFSDRQGLHLQLQEQEYV
jgi:hypothetical protein